MHLYSSRSSIRRDHLSYFISLHSISNRRHRMTSKKSFIVCKHTEIYDCDCISYNQKLKSVYNFHDPKRCVFEKHKQFKESGFILVKKPYWRCACSCPFNAEEQEIVIELCKIFGLACECTSERHCGLCRYILRKHSKLYISSTQLCSIKPLIKLYRHFNKQASAEKWKAWSFF